MKYEWAVVGGGVAGIVLTEVLAREGHSVVLIEKQDKLAGATTGLFHEWIHTGCLYTLIPDKLHTLKFLLGAIDDLLEYYSSFERMNLTPSEAGLRLGDGSGWFVPNHIHFKYRLRRGNLPWLMIMSRSIHLIELIKQHDWLRRRAGKLYEISVADQLRAALSRVRDIVSNDHDFLDIETSDFTTNSRMLLKDLVATALHNHAELSLGNPVIRVEDQTGYKALVTDRGTIKADRVVICAGRNIPQFLDVQLKTSIAPIAVVRGLDPSAESFVELDYITKNCINLLTKPDGIGMIGGISVDREDQAENYLEHIIAEHQKRTPGIQVLGSYNGLKNEITFRHEDRNYLYHIVPTEPGIWAVVPGKFTLGFSLAVEFYRRVYNRNPRKFFNTVTDHGGASDYVSETLWHDIVNNIGSRPNDGVLGGVI
jgi:hypothetical protein